MKFLQELSLLSEEVDDIINDQDQDYVPLPDKGSSDKNSKHKKTKKSKFPTSDAAEDSLINTLWRYNNADAN